MTVGFTSAANTRFVARAPELATLSAALATAAEGTPTTVLVGGEGGVGKSHLIREFSRRARMEGVRVLTGVCIGLAAGELPYAPLAEMLRGLARDLGGQTVRAVAGRAYPALSQVVPYLDDAFDDTAADTMDPADGAATATTAGTGEQAGPAPVGRLLEAVLRLLHRLAERAPLLLVIEDLQWADRSTLDLLSFLAATLSRERLVLVASYRSNDLGPGHPLRGVLTELTRSGRALRLELARFTEAELATFLTALVGAAPGAAQLRRIYALSDGNAYFAEELVAGGALAEPTPADVPPGPPASVSMSALTSTSTAAPASAPVSAAPGLGAEPLPLPRSIRDVVLARVETLTADAREVLRLIATAGRTIRHQLLDTLCEMPQERLTAALRECVAYHVLVTDTGKGTYVFRHAVGREVVYADLLPGERTRLHAALAEALRTQPELGAVGGPALAAELAYHWHAAGVLPRALAAAVVAAEMAADACAFAESHRQYTRALALWHRVDDPVRAAGVPHSHLLERGAEAARWAGHTDVAIAWMLELSAQQSPRRSPAERAALWERLGRYRWESGDGEGSTRAYEQAVSLLADEAPSGQRAGVLGRLATSHVLAGRYSVGLSLATQAADLAAAVGAPAARSRGLNMAGVALTMIGRPDQGVRALRAALEIALGSDDAEELLRAYSNLGFALEKAGRLEESLAVARTGLARSRELGIELTGGGVLLTNAVAVLSLLGRWDEAVTAITDAFHRDVPVGSALFLHLLAAEIDIGRGRFVDAEARLEAARVSAGRVRESQFAGQWHGCRAELAIWRAEHDVARAAVLAGLDAVSEDAPLTLYLCALGLRAEADRVHPGLVARRRSPGHTPVPPAVDQQVLAEGDDRAGLAPAAAGFVDRVRAVIRDLPPRPLPDVAALHLQCRAEQARGRGQDTPRQWARVAERWERIGRPGPTAYARWREAAAALRSRDSRAGPALRQAHRLATGLDAAPLRGEIEQLARRARIDLAAGTERDGSGAEATSVTGLGAEVAGPGCRDQDRRQPVSGTVGPHLTPRERQVLGYLVAGHSNRIIGRRLFITEKTASVHVSNILAKLSVTSRGEAAAAALRLGLAQAGADEQPR
ncbi:AAA family ATPase [Frankia sp. AiPa1]|uniref:helix-turn-helix transcriptional regulator n=1 Tax=Frankia sp. AiPa1 TaxID=573492 RepID=UPI00202B3E42|nr:AAA family ATPase [Frankia sp. AiPa1]MCL9759569.1 AAA family ATPase [Frankia sp. AiPa1]